MSRVFISADRIINVEELTDLSNTVIRVVVNDCKRRATGFLSVRLVNGRIQYTLTTKKKNGNETIKTAIADWAPIP